MIPALVLTAGLATRLRPLSFVRAKAAMPVAGEPLVRRVLRQLHAEGIDEAVLNLHHLPHTITRVVGDGSDIGVRVRYSWEVPILGSAGGPRLALPLLDAPTFLIVNGDTLTTVDVAALVAEHHRTGALVTMAVAAGSEHGGERPEWRAKYGGVLVDASGAVTGFSTRGAGGPSLHFVGIQVADAVAFAALSVGAAAESVGGLYPALIRSQPGSIRAHVCTTDFFDIGTPADYLETSLLLAAREPERTLRGAGVRVDSTARVTDSVLWDNVEVGADAELQRCIVADDTRVPSGTSWTHVTLRPANGELAPGERQVGQLAVGPI